MTKALIRPSTRALLAVNLLLVASVMGRLLLPTISVEQASSDFQKTATAEPNVLTAMVSMASADLSAAMTERPLFVEARRQPKEEPAVAEDGVADQAPAAPPVSAINGLILTGVVVVGDMRIALISGPGGTEPQQISKGESLRGWRVVSVTANALVLSNGNETREIAFPTPTARDGVRIAGGG